METKKRSIMKAISFRLLATGTTMAFIYAMTGNLKLAGGIGLFDIITKLIIYYYHERIWEKVKWGKLNSNPYLEKYNENYTEEL